MSDLVKPQFGRLETVALREGWLGEATDFTPWLAQPDNIVLLGVAIQMELEVESQEKNVGPFRADILVSRHPELQLRTDRKPTRVHRPRPPSVSF